MHEYMYVYIQIIIHKQVYIYYTFIPAYFENSYDSRIYKDAILQFWMTLNNVFHTNMDGHFGMFFSCLKI